MPVVKTIGPVQNAAISSVDGNHHVWMTWDPPADIPDDTEVYYSVRITRNGVYEHTNPLGEIGSPPPTQPAYVASGTSGDVLHLEILAFSYSVSPVVSTTMP